MTEQTSDANTLKAFNAGIVDRDHRRCTGSRRLPGQNQPSHPAVRAAEGLAFHSGPGQAITGLFRAAIIGCFDLSHEDLGSRQQAKAHRVALVPAGDQPWPHLRLDLAV
jgi:hypothetical protein